MKIKEKIPKPSSAKEEIGLKNLSSDDEWFSKGCWPEDGDTKFDEDNEVTSLIPSFIDLKNNNK